MVTSTLTANQRELSARLHVVQRELKLIAQAWHTLGAQGFVIMQDNVVLMSIPHGIISTAPMLKAPIKIGDSIVLLCAVGLADVQYQSRLFADAHLLHSLLQQEREMEHLTNELVNYQDQLIALFDLNRSLRYETKVQNMLYLLAQQTAQFMQLAHVFMMLHPVAEEAPTVAHSGEAYVSLEQVSQWFSDMRQSGDYLLYNHPVSDIQYLLIMPIESDGQLIGALGLINHEAQFTMPQIKLVRAIADYASTHIHKSLLYQEKIEQERISAEMNLARNVQMSLLPKVPQSVPGLEIWAHARPAQEVGGDFYNFARIGNELRFALGDVAGKGMSAALLMVMCRTILRVLDDHSPRQLLSQFTEHLYDDFTQVDSFVTLFVGEYDFETHKLTYANGGHSPVIYCPAEGGATMLEADSPPIGVLPMCLAADYELHLNVSDVLVITSDGIPEAPQLLGKMLGYENMLQLIELYRHKPAETIGKMLLQAANVYNMPQDDQTLIIIKRVK